MNGEPSVAAPAPTTDLSPDTLAAIDQVCARIAPTWPLDRLIAVNPWWSLRHLDMPKVSVRLAALSGSRAIMRRQYFASLWLRRIKPHHLQEAAGRLNVSVDQETLLAHLNGDEPAVHWLNLSEWLDRQPEREGRMAWSDEVIHQISQSCALYFQRIEQQPASKDNNTFYAYWHDAIVHDRGLELLMGQPGLLNVFRSLPNTPDALFAAAIQELGIHPDILADYLYALLLDINGWASWVAYLQWQDRLQNRPDSTLMRELLAARLGWELAMHRHCQARYPVLAQRMAEQWESQTQDWPVVLELHQQDQQLTWVWQVAAELSYQESLHKKLVQPPVLAQQPAPLLQAAFCIDVRSEPLRAALEQQSPEIQTLGFAGFFGLPLEYKPAGTQWSQPHLPGLLAPQIQVTEAGVANPEVAARRYNWHARFHGLSDAPAVTFSLVESFGLGAAFKLARESLFSGHDKSTSRLQPPQSQWRLQQNGQDLTTAQKADLLSKVLRAMGLGPQFAPTVLFVGHGSTTRNNAHAASLNCGACAGQTGLLSAQVLAQLLNDAAVRAALLSDHGVAIPAQTRFVAALHDTVTDTIDLPDTEVSEQVALWIQQACQTARRNRAHSLGLPVLEDDELSARLAQRSQDWSELRPEWGLTNNAAFIAGPRHYSRQVDLQGRCFLHDYDWQRDDGFQVLEQIMTAPVVVGQWINMQYYASVVDNYKYGSGNKMLHNVVGGHFGVFEGNGGDLRIGLPIQSVHDGNHWRHEPLRLSVYLAAPREAIQAVYERHEAVRNLVDHEWMYLFCWEPEQGIFSRLLHGIWHTEFSAAGKQ